MMEDGRRNQSSPTKARIAERLGTLLHPGGFYERTL